MPRSKVVPVPVSAPQHERAGAVAEQYAGRAVLPVEQAREGLGADHQRGPGLARDQKLVGHREREDEAAADRLQVEPDGAERAELALHGHRAGREGVVRGGGREHDQVDPLGADAGVGERRGGGGPGEIGGQLALGRDVALADAGALDDPGIAGVDRAGELVVGDDPGRQIGAAANDARAEHALAPRRVRRPARAGRAAPLARAGAIRP